MRGRINENTRKVDKWPSALDYRHGNEKHNGRIAMARKQVCTKTVAVEIQFHGRILCTCDLKVELQKSQRPLAKHMHQK
jgi:hypothetical protein